MIVTKRRLNISLVKRNGWQKVGRHRLEKGQPLQVRRKNLNRLKNQAGQFLGRLLKERVSHGLHQKGEANQGRVLRTKKVRSKVKRRKRKMVAKDLAHQKIVTVKKSVRSLQRKRRDQSHVIGLDLAPKTGVPNLVVVDRVQNLVQEGNGRGQDTKKRSQSGLVPETDTQGHDPETEKIDLDLVINGPDLGTDGHVLVLEVSDTRKVKRVDVDPHLSGNIYYVLFLFL